MDWINVHIASTDKLKQTLIKKFQINPENAKQAEMFLILYKQDTRKILKSCPSSIIISVICYKYLVRIINLLKVGLDLNQKDLIQLRWKQTKSEFVGHPINRPVF